MGFIVLDFLDNFLFLLNSTLLSATVCLHSANKQRSTNKEPELEGLIMCIDETFIIVQHKQKSLTSGFAPSL